MIDYSDLDETVAELDDAEREYFRTLGMREYFRTLGMPIRFDTDDERTMAIDRVIDEEGYGC